MSRRPTMSDKCHQTSGPCGQWSTPSFEAFPNRANQGVTRHVERRIKVSPLQRRVLPPRTKQFPTEYNGRPSCQIHFKRHISNRKTKLGNLPLTRLPISPTLSVADSILCWVQGMKYITYRYRPCSWVPNALPQYHIIRAHGNVPSLYKRCKT